MSRPRDLVGFAMGDVRVPFNELGIEERLRLFHVFGATISRKYRVEDGGSRGGGEFRPWFECARDRSGALPDSDGFMVTKRFTPSESGYLETTRIFVLAAQVFRLPDCQTFRTKDWQQGAHLGFARLCLTQGGELWFEWFETIVGNKLAGNVNLAEYQQVHVNLYNQAQPLPQRLMELLEIEPGFLGRSLHMILELINREATMRERRAERDRGIYNRLAEIGKPFEISLV